MSRRQKKKRERRGKGRGWQNGQVFKVNYRFRQGLLMFKEIQTEVEKGDETKDSFTSPPDRGCSFKHFTRCYITMFPPFTLFIITTPISKDKKETNISNGTTVAFPVAPTLQIV